MAKFSFFWGGTVSFETWDLELWMVQEGCRSCNQVVQSSTTISHDEKNRATTQTLLDHFFKREDTRTCDITVRHEWNCSLPSNCYCPWFFSSSTSHLLSLLQSVILPSLFTSDASHCTALPYFHHCGEIKMFPFLCVCFFECIICVITIINVLQYSII